MALLKDLIVQGASRFIGDVQGSKFIVDGATSSQFLKGDGTLDSSTYLTSSDISNKADKPLIIEVTDGDSTVPSGTFNSITTSLAAGREVLIKYYDLLKYVYIPLRTSDSTDDYYSFSGIVGSTVYYIGIYDDDSIERDINELSHYTHTHGSITNAGEITSDTSVASGDKLVIIDNSDSSKIKRSNISFDGSTTTKALTKKGTWEDFVPASTLASNEQFAIIEDGLNNDHVLRATTGDGVNYIFGDRDGKNYAIGLGNALGDEDYILATTDQLEKYVIDYSKQYFTTVALENGTINFTIFERADISYIESIAYSKNDGEWIETQNAYRDVVISVNVVKGDVVRWKGIAGQIGYNASDNGGVFTSTCRVNVQGNIMSLLYGDNFDDKATLENDYAFASLFDDVENNESCLIVDASNLILPAMALTDYCYAYMFYGCTSLTTAPELPATTLVTGCYCGMFSGCTSLTTAPELPATTLAYECYSDMFEGCTSLTIAPELPATTLVTICYYGMFSGCTNLNYIKCLATNISASNCTKNWVNNVAATGIFIKADSMTSWTTGANGIPSGWTIVDDQDYIDLKKYQADNIYAPKASPTFTGTPVAPTATSGDSSTQIATTAFVQGEISTQLGNIETLLQQI